MGTETQRCLKMLDSLKTSNATAVADFASCTSEAKSCPGALGSVYSSSAPVVRFGQNLATAKPISTEATTSATPHRNVETRPAKSMLERLRLVPFGELPGYSRHRTQEVSPSISVQRTSTQL